MMGWLMLIEKISSKKIFYLDITWKSPHRVQFNKLFYKSRRSILPDRHLLNIPSFLKTHIYGYWLVLPKKTDYEASCHWGSQAGRLSLIQKSLGFQKLQPRFSVIQWILFALRTLGLFLSLRILGICSELKLNKVLNITTWWYN